MGRENRIATRYDDMGKVVCPEICALPGGLDNISKSGCKVHFPLTVVVDLETEYEMKITLAKKPDETPLLLICKPQWVKECENTTEIGFSILYSPDNNRLLHYVDFLADSEKDELPEII